MFCLLQSSWVGCWLESVLATSRKEVLAAVVSHMARQRVRTPCFTQLHLQYCIHRYPYAVAKVFQISNQMGKYANPRIIMTENGLTTFIIYFNDNRKYKPSVEFVSSLNTWIDLEMSQFRENGKVRQ